MLTMNIHFRAEWKGGNVHTCSVSPSKKKEKKRKGEEKEERRKKKESICLTFRSICHRLQARPARESQGLWGTSVLTDRESGPGHPFC